MPPPEEVLLKQSFAQLAASQREPARGNTVLVRFRSDMILS
jgi:hypothetical protein